MVGAPGYRMNSAAFWELSERLGKVCPSSPRATAGLPLRLEQCHPLDDRGILRKGLGSLRDSLHLLREDLCFFP